METGDKRKSALSTTAGDVRMGLIANLITAVGFVVNLGMVHTTVGRQDLISLIQGQTIGTTRIMIGIKVIKAKMGQLERIGEVNKFTKRFCH